MLRRVARQRTERLTRRRSMDCIEWFVQVRRGVLKRIPLHELIAGVSRLRNDVHAYDIEARPSVAVRCSSGPAEEVKEPRRSSWSWRLSVARPDLGVFRLCLAFCRSVLGHALSNSLASRT